MLIGCDVPEVHEVIEQRIGVGRQPYAVKTILGWIFRGPTGVKGVNVKQVNLIGVEEDSLVDKLAKFYELEFKELGNPDKRSSSLNDRKVLDITEESIELVDGRYIIGLPWRESATLPNNYALVRRRLECLKKRLSRNKDLCTRYAAVMRDHLSKGYISLAGTGTNADSWYLPHHPVLNAHKPGKVRIVFDCAAQFKGHSLNSELLSGPNLTNDLTGVLLQFRKYPVALCSDIEEMFLQLRVPTTDRMSLSFLWWVEGKTHKRSNLTRQNPCWL